MSKCKEAFQKYIPAEWKWNLAAIGALGITGTLGILPEITNGQTSYTQAPAIVVTDQEYQLYFPLMNHNSGVVATHTSVPVDPPTPVIPDVPSPTWTPTSERPTHTPIPTDNTPLPTATLQPQESPTPTATSGSITVKSVESMNQTKDRVCARFHLSVDPTRSRNRRQPHHCRRTLRQ